MAARTRPLNSLLRKEVKFDISLYPERIVREMLDELSSPNVLAFPDFEAAISGSRKFRLVTDASADGFDVVIKQQQADGSIRHLRYLSRTTLDNERKWGISELECAAIVWAIKRNRQMFYGTPFEVETDHQPLQDLASLSSDKSNRVQGRFEFLNAYTFTLKHRSKNANSNANVLSRVPLPATADFDHRRTQVWVDSPTPRVDWQTLLGGLAATPGDAVSWGEEGVACSRKKVVSRCGKQCQRNS